MKNEFYIFNLDGCDYYGYTTTGKFIFKDKDNILKNHKYLPFYVLYYVTNYDFDDLEFFFRLMGFSAFKLDELPDFIVNPTIINLPTPQDIDNYTNGMYLDANQAIEYIEKIFGEGAVNKYFEIRKAQLMCKKNQLLQQLSHFEVEEKKREDIKNDLLKIMLKKDRSYE